MDETEQEAFQAARDEMEQLMGLMRHPGWKLFLGLLQNTQQQSFLGMKYAKDGVELARHVTANVMVTELSDWPRQRIEAIKQSFSGLQRSGQ